MTFTEDSFNTADYVTSNNSVVSEKSVSSTVEPEERHNGNSSSLEALSSMVKEDSLKDDVTSKDLKGKSIKKEGTGFLKNQKAEKKSLRKTDEDDKKKSGSVRYEKAEKISYKKRESEADPMNQSKVEIISSKKLIDSDRNSQESQFHGKNLNYENYPNNSNNVQVVTKYIFLEKPTTVFDIVPFAVVFFIYGMIIQTIFTIWKKVHKKSHDLFLLFLVVILPPFLLFCFSDRLLGALWAGFVFFVLSYFKKASSEAIHKETPREIYKIFRRFFFYSYISIAAGQILTISTFMFYLNYLIPSLRLL